MTPETTVLAFTAASIAFVHTLLGPDHYVPFVAMARARGWNLSRTLRITLLCGLSHLVGSVLLGLAGVYLGLQLSSLEGLESLRGELAAWLLMGFGLAYAAWGLRQARRDRPHSHWHSHGRLTHDHEHNHHSDHAHVHDETVEGTQRGARNLTPWMIFVIFVLGPCEPLIPILMYPAARQSPADLLLVTTVFGLVTVLTMLGSVIALLWGLRFSGFRHVGRFGHAIAGGLILSCGLGMVFLGL